MSKNNSVIDRMIENLRTSGKLEEVVKEAQEDAAEATETTEEVTTETDEEKVAEADNSGIDYEKIADMVAKKLSTQVEGEVGTDKVASLVEELNKEAEELGASQEMIVTALYNGFFSDEELSGQDIVKMAEEEDSLVPYVIDNIYKYAAAADAMLAEKYDEDYDENDVIKMAAVLIESTPDPFGFGQIEKEAEAQKEAEESDSDNALEDLAEEFVSKIRQKLNN